MAAPDAAHAFYLISHWRVPGTVEEVATVLRDAAGLTRWWPEVYLDVRELDPGGEGGVGRVLAIHSRGWLPYTLRWQLRVTDSDWPHGWSIAATGDLAGIGRWTLAQDGIEVALTYDWQVRADQPLLRRLSPVLKPAFAANHRWAMAKGEAGLRAELARRAGERTHR